MRTPHGCRTRGRVLTVILDASAVLAFLLEEPGKDRVMEVMLTGAAMTTVNIAEVATQYVLRGARRQAETLCERLPVELVPVDQDLAMRAARMAAITGPFGLSLGERVCLALAQRTGRPALTVNRSWLDVAGALGVTVEAIR